MTLPKVLYIMGAGRSGSTVLGIALGNVPSVFYAGEMHSWVIFEGVPRSEKEETVSFWERVYARIPDASGHFGRRFSRQIEHHRALLHPVRRLDKSLNEAHAEVTADLVRAVVQESGCPWVVDSSHYPLRAGRLRANPDLDAYVINLVRHPVDVINALQKDVQREKPMGVLKANLYTLAVWALSAVQYVRFRRDRKIRVRYEDLLERPCETVNRICERFELSGRLERDSDLGTGRVFQGNRVREKDTITIRPQPSKRLLSPMAVALSTVLQLPVLLHYRYLLRSPRKKSEAAATLGG